MRALKGQLTARGIIIGSIGCVIITAASMYTALKISMLPWPILFAAVISLFFIKLLNRRGKRATSLNEVNVTHTIMSAGAMVAGGLAFTIPGIWILGNYDEVSWWQTLTVALAGVTLGLIGTVLFRRHFIERSKLEFPMGVATTKTLVAGNSGGKVGTKLFSSMGLAAVYTMLIQWFKALPPILLSWVNIPGVAFGIYNSPMVLAVGFIVGTGAVLAWSVGALLGHFGIVFAGSNLGFWSVEMGAQVASSLGMGLMMGCGIAVVIKVLLPVVFKKRKAAAAATNGTMLESATSETAAKSDAGSETAAAAKSATKQDTPRALNAFHKFIEDRMSVGVAALMVAAVALVLCFVLELGPLPSLVIVVMVWVTIAMSAQSVGQTGIDPMEIFGLIVLLVVAAFSAVPQVQLFFVAATVAVACGLVGDLMNDFKAGYDLGTNPRAQWIGQLIGGVLGAVVAVVVLGILVQAYGTDAFGPLAASAVGEANAFPAAQANIVATLITGIPSLPAFIIGLAAGFVLYLLRLPAMMVGLGVYLPFMLSFTAFLGLIVKWTYNLICRQRLKGLSEEEQNQRKLAQNETGIVVFSGLLGGESIAQVIIALLTITMFTIA